MVQMPSMAASATAPLAPEGSLNRILQPKTFVAIALDIEGR